MRLLPCSTTLCIVLHAGCTADVPVTARSIARDSAGIRVVENFAPALAEGSWTVDEQPLLEIGADETNEDQVLYNVAGAVRLDDGRVVVAGSGNPMLRWLDADGRLTHATGRPGGGPGEFGGGENAWIMHLWHLPDDSIGTWEHSARRMQVFDGEANFARAVQLDLPPDMPPGAYPQIFGRTDSGFVAVMYPVTSRTIPANQIRHDTLTFLRYDREGRFLSEITRTPDFVTFVMEMELPNGSRARGDGRPLFAPAPSFAARRGQFVYGSGDEFELHVRDPNGAVTTIIRRVENERTLTAAMIDEHIEARLDRITDPERRRSARRELEAAPVMDRLPAHSRLMLDRTDHTWVRNYAFPGDTARPCWSVFDSDGRWITDVRTPHGWDIQEIGSDWILTLTSTDLDVEVLRLHRLVRQPD